MWRLSWNGGDGFRPGRGSGGGPFAISGGVQQLRDEVPTGWGLVAAHKEERLAHNDGNVT